MERLVPGVHQAGGAYGEKQLYGKTVIGVIGVIGVIEVIRSTFLLDEAGVVIQASYAVKATGNVARLLRDAGL